MGFVRTACLLRGFRHSAVSELHTWLQLLNNNMFNSHVNGCDVLMILLSSTDLPIRKELICLTEIGAVTDSILSFILKTFHVPLTQLLKSWALHQ